MTEKKEHPFAYALRWVADGEVLQANSHNCGFNDVDHETVLVSAYTRPTTAIIFRIKPRTIRIGVYDVSEPMRTAPAEGVVYYAINPFENDAVILKSWYGHGVDSSALKNGMCWLNRKDAELAAKAIRELLTGAVK